MALNIENNVEFKLGAGLTSGTLLLTVKSGKESLLPTAPFKLTLIKFDSAGAVTQREIVTVTNKASNILTITRASEACPKDDSATTHVSVPYDFDESDSAFMTLTATIIKDIDIAIGTKLDITTYNTEKALFVSSSTGNDDYQITDTTVASYIDGKTYKVRADVANTGPATLEVNSLGLIAIEKIESAAFTPLITGDIIANQIFWATYNSAESVFQFSVDPASTSVPDSSETVKGIIEISDTAQALAGVNDLTAMTPKKAKDNYVSKNFTVYYGIEDASLDGTTPPAIQYTPDRGLRLNHSGSTAYTAEFGIKVPAGVTGITSIVFGQRAPAAGNITLEEFSIVRKRVGTSTVTNVTDTTDRIYALATSSSTSIEETTINSAGYSGLVIADGDVVSFQYKVKSTSAVGWELGYIKITYS